MADKPAKRSLASNAAILIISGALSTGLQFAVGVALANALSKTDFGTYKQVYLLYGIITPLFSLALPGSLLYFVPRAVAEERARIISQTLWVLTAFGALLGVLLWITATLWANVFSNPSLALVLKWFALVPVTALPASALPSVAVALDRAKLAAISSMVLNAVNLAAVAGAAFIGRDILPVIALTIVSSAIQGVATFWLSATTAGGLPLSIRWQSLREQFGYAIPLALSGLVGLLAYQTDRLLISLEFSPALFAVYAVGAVEVPLISTISSSVNSVIMPRISELHAHGRTDEIVSLYREAVRKSAVIVLPFFGYLMLMAPEFITLLYPGYAESVPIFQVYLLLLPLRVATYGLILQATGATRMLLRGSAYYLGGNAVISYGLMLWLGLPGPAWGTVVATVAIAAWYLTKSARELGVPVLSLMPWRPVITLTAVSVTAGFLSQLASRLAADTDVFRLLVAAAIMAVLYFGLGRLTGAVTVDDINRLRVWTSKYAPRLDTRSSRS